MQACRPHYRKDMDKLKKVHRRGTNMVEGLEVYSYDDGLKILEKLLLLDKNLES